MAQKGMIMIATQSYAAFDSTSPLRPYALHRREPGPKDVSIEIKYCGICHTDLHFVKNDLGMTKYPVVPGHEIAGIVERVGSAVTRFKAGDHVGVGCLVNSCRQCASCTKGEEQFCPNFILTYSSIDRDGSVTQGGYSTKITVDEDFVLRMPNALPLDRAAPLLCAGITTYSPLRTWGAGKGTKLAVIGLGGLGHMAVKLASAMGAEVTVISTSDRKKEDAQRLGAKKFLVSPNKEAMAAAAGSFNLIINTISAAHELNDHINLLAVDGTIVLLGIATEPMPISSVPIIFGRRRIAGSLIGGLAQTQEMLDFCAQHGITSDVEVIPAGKINEAFERLGRSDVRYRFVIDVGTMKG
jgi:alcohol dehydrogenase (NADP+)